MWIVARLVIFIGSFLIRYLDMFRLSIKFDEKTSSGIEFGDITSKHKGNIVAYYVGVPLTVDVVFKIAAEKDFNRILKRWGLSSEIQTGDVSFDDQYYIGSDHLYFNRALCADKQIRHFIHEIMSKYPTIQEIVCDGHKIYIKSKAKAIEPNLEVVELLHKLAEKIKPVSQVSKFQSYKDPYVFKLLIFESISFALLFYAFESFFEIMVVDHYALEAGYEIYIPGAVFGLVVVTLLVLAFIKLFRESARSHYILSINIIIILCSSPFWGTKTFIDLNKYLDKSTVVEKRIVIDRKEVKTHRSRRGGTTYTYYWYYRAADADKQSMARTMSLSGDLFGLANEGDLVVIKTRNGAFNYPYRLSMNGSDL